MAIGDTVKTGVLAAGAKSETFSETAAAYRLVRETKNTKAFGEAVKTFEKSVGSDGSFIKALGNIGTGGRARAPGLNMPNFPGSTGGTEEKREEKARWKTQETLLMGIYEFTKSTSNSLKDMLKEMTKKAVGSLAGLMAFPIIIIIEFFRQLQREWKVLKMLGRWLKSTRLGQGLSRIFTPIRTLTNWAKTSKLGVVVKNFTKGFGKAWNGLFDVKKIKADFRGLKVSFMKPINDFLFAFRNVGKNPLFAKPITVKHFTGFFQKAGAIFGSISKFIAGSKTFAQLVKWAGMIGKLMGKVFFPITLAISIYDFVTGFMKGYEEGGLLEGFKQGTTKLFNGLISMPLDFLKDGVAWLLKKMGFDEESDALKAFSFKDLFTKLIGSVFDAVGGAIDWVKSIFKADSVPKALNILWKGLLKGAKTLMDILFAPVNFAINWIMKKFDFKGKGDAFTKDGKFSIGTLFTNMIDGIMKAIINALKGIPVIGKMFSTDEEKIKKMEADIADHRKDLKAGDTHVGPDLLGGKAQDRTLLIKDLENEIAKLKKNERDVQRSYQGSKESPNIQQNNINNNTTTMPPGNPSYRAPLATSWSGMGF